MNFEREMCEELRKAGYWVHFMQPNPAGAQPFDIIACRGGCPLALDCKTSSHPFIELSRLEANQITAFELWIDRGNPDPEIAVKYLDDIYMISYSLLRSAKKSVPFISI